MSKKKRIKKRKINRRVKKQIKNKFKKKIRRKGKSKKNVVKLTQEKYDLIKERIVEIMKSSSIDVDLPSTPSKLTEEQFKTITEKINKIVKKVDENITYDEEL